MPTRRGWLKWGLVLGLVTTLVGVAGIALVLHHRSEGLRFAYWRKPLAPSELDALAHRTGWSIDRFEPEPGVTLVGLVRQPTDPDAPWILYFPGNGSILVGAQEWLEALAAGADWGLAAHAPRGFDVSTGRPTRDAILADSLKVQKRLADTYAVEVRRMHVVGFSLGTGLAMSVAGHLASAGTPPASLTLLAPFTSMDLARDVWYHRLVAPERWDNIPLVPAIAAPVLIVHGTADEALPPSMSTELAAELGARARLVQPAGLGHHEILTDEATLETVRDFVRGSTVRDAAAP